MNAQVLEEQLKTLEWDVVQEQGKWKCKACADLANAQKPFENSNLGEQIKRYSQEKDNFHINHPDTNWESQIEHGEEIGLGCSEYELIEIK